MLSSDKDIFVISDLHLGDHGKRDNFFVNGKDKEGNEINRLELFNKFLDMVEQRNGQLVIVGDLFEFWQANIGKVIEKNLALLDRLAKMKAIYVVGNHDIDLEPLIKECSNIFSHPFFAQMTTSFVQNIGEKRFKFFHGHEVDPYNKGDTPGWGRMMAILAGIIEDKIGAKLNDNQSTEDVLVKLGTGIKEKIESALNTVKNTFIREEDGKGMTPAQNKNLVADHFIHMEAERKKDEFEVAVCGHTHMPGKLDNWYVNSGSWVKFADNEPVGDFIWIYKTGEYDVFTFKEAEVQPIETEFVKNPETGLVQNFDFINGCPLK